MMNVNIYDNGAAFCVTVNGMIVEAKKHTRRRLETHSVDVRNRLSGVHSR